MTTEAFSKVLVFVLKEKSYSQVSAYAFCHVLIKKWLIDWLIDWLTSLTYERVLVSHRESGQVRAIPASPDCFSQQLLTFATQHNPPAHVEMPLNSRCRVADKQTIILHNVRDRMLVKKPHCRSAQVWHALSRNHTTHLPPITRLSTSGMIHTWFAFPAEAGHHFSTQQG